MPLFVYDDQNQEVARIWLICGGYAQTPGKIEILNWTSGMASWVCSTTGVSRTLAIRTTDYEVGEELNIQVTVNNEITGEIDSAAVTVMTR